MQWSYRLHGILYLHISQPRVKLIHMQRRISFTADDGCHTRDQSDVCLILDAPIFFRVLTLPIHPPPSSSPSLHRCPCMSDGYPRTLAHAERGTGTWPYIRLQGQAVCLSLKAGRIMKEMRVELTRRLAVDAYVWLHKGAFGCAEELVKGQKTTK